MAIIDSILPEFDHETTTTRKLLERIPGDRADWKPHPKSMTVSDLGVHLSNLLMWARMTMQEAELDLNPPAGTPVPSPRFESVEKLLETYDANRSAAREALAAVSDAELAQPWSLKNGGQTVFTMPRVNVLRFFVMNHLVHHRGQLSVYLRMLEIPLPSIYGPTADGK